MMTLDKTLIIFIIGAVVGMTVALLPPPEELGDYLGDPTKFAERIASGVADFWLFIFLLVHLITLPMLAIESLRKHLTNRKFFPYGFMAGSAFGLAIISLISLLFFKLKVI
jgi:hypothetical protein